MRRAILLLFKPCAESVTASTTTHETEFQKPDRAVFGISRRCHHRAGGFVVVYGVVYFTAYNHLDEDIQQEKEEVLNNLRWLADSIIIDQMPEWEEKEHQQVEVNPVFLQLVDAEGTCCSVPPICKRHFAFRPQFIKRRFFQQSNQWSVHSAGTVSQSATNATLSSGT